MEETIAELRRQVEEQQSSEKRQSDARKRQSDARKRLSAVKRKRDRREKSRGKHEKRQNGACNPTHFFASSIAVTILCPNRSKLRQMQPSRLRATWPTQ
jgi:hypothetical protein